MRVLRERAYRTAYLQSAQGKNGKRWLAPKERNDRYDPVIAKLERNSPVRFGFPSELRTIDHFPRSPVAGAQPGVRL